MFFLSSSILACSSNISVLVRRYNCNSTIAFACSKVNENSFTKLSIESLLFLLALITLITSSNIDIALTSPSKICKSLRAFFKSNSVLLLTTIF